jgi:hypothetical protein
MKRLVGTFAFVLLSTAVWADAPFTIVRPADGSRVRETVRILIPKNSVPPGGYIGIFVGGKFIEATIPPLDKTKKFYEYDLDTKGRKIQDGKLNLEAVLYEDFHNQPRIVNRSSVDVTVQNSAESKIPAEGILLRYKWKPGTEAIYDVSTKLIVDTGDSAKNSLGGKADETTSEGENLRVLYSTEARYPGGDGLVRIQGIPDKGKDSTYLTVLGDTQPKKWMDYDMASIYQRLTPTGLEVFGSVPFALPLEGTAGEGAYTDLLVVRPLPTLPTRRVKVGDSWSARFQDGNLDLSKVHEVNSLVNHYIARGEFKDVEWEMGHPCARIVDSIEVAQPSLESQKLKKEGREFTGNKVQLEETVWFALDRGQVVKIIRTQTVEGQVAYQSNFGGAGGGTSAPGGAGPRGARGGGLPPGVPGGNRFGGGADKSFGPNGLQSSIGDFQKGRFGQGGGAAFGPGGPGGPGGFGAGARGGFGQRGRAGGGVAPASTAFVRTTVQETFVLEQ